jgi:hypothetical protein
MTKNTPFFAANRSQTYHFATNRNGLNQSFSKGSSYFKSPPFKAKIYPPQAGKPNLLTYKIQVALGVIPKATLPTPFTYSYSLPD